MPSTELHNGARIAVLGGGVMGGAIARTLVQAELPVAIVEKQADRAEELAQSGIVVTDLATAVHDANVVIVVVKPQDVRSLLNDLQGQLRPGTVVISIAAGITTRTIEDALPDVAVIRAMPNTPARIQQGVTAVSAGRSCPAAALDLARDLLGYLGLVLVLPEDLQDAATAVSGSGPAYLFYLAEAMVEAAQELGLPADQARQAIAQTLVGAAALLAASTASPAQLRTQVTSPGGTTAAAVSVLDTAQVRDSFVEALRAARDRARELAGS
jgi:pyrroline-5-carboxylate reductase